MYYNEKKISCDFIKDIHVFVMSTMLDTTVGCVEGFDEGKTVGLGDGFDVGNSLGQREGKLIEGSQDGLTVGNDIDGSRDGVEVGFRLGKTEGM